MLSRKTFSETRSANTTFNGYKLDRDLESALKYFKANNSEIKFGDINRSVSPYNQKFSSIFGSDKKVINPQSMIYFWINIINILRWKCRIKWEEKEFKER